MKLSVSLITFQEEAYIAQALDSVLAQETDFDFEIVVGDDASTDGTRDILNAYRHRYPDKVKLLLPESNYGDFGLSNVRATLDNCRGQYIALLDGDDYWTEKTKLQQQVDFLDGNPECSFSAHRIVHSSNDGHTELSELPASSAAEKPADSAAEKQVSNTGKSNVSSNWNIYTIESLIRLNFAHKISTVARSDAVRAVPEWFYTSNLASADWVFNLLLAQQGHIGFIDSPMAIHRKRGGSVSDVHGQERLLRDRLRTLNILGAEFPQYQSAIKHARLRTNIRLAIVNLSPGIYHWAQRAYCYRRSGYKS
ncbi:MAG: glycosyltransferase [Granulosicoccus sp.]|nr:glycosyltransferase [Granulosicoccus sp.]